MKKRMEIYSFPYCYNVYSRYEATFYNEIVIMLIYIFYYREIPIIKVKYDEWSTDHQVSML